jgi:hypothetical protein
MRMACAVVLALIPSLAHGDVVVLKGGRRLSGVLVEKSERSVVLDVGPGRIAIPMAQVERVEGGRSALAEYQARAASIGDGDADGWAELAVWANAAQLLTQAREAFDRALSIDPGNALAHRGLGHVLVPSGWLTVEDANRARGLIAFEGRWVTPQERQIALQERAEDASAEAARRAAELRIREAEERTAAAEAEAARARAEAEAASAGIPYGWVANGCGLNCGRPGRTVWRGARRVWGPSAPPPPPVAPAKTAPRRPAASKPLVH